MSIPSLELGEVSTIQIGPFGSLLHKADYIEDGVPVINPMHIAPYGIEADHSYSVATSKADELTRYFLRTGEVVMGRRGEMGRCAVVQPEQAGMICGTGSMKIIPQAEHLNAEYLVHMIRTPKARAELENAASGVTMLNLNAKALAKLKIPLPPLQEQKRIAQVLDQADALRRLRTRALDKLNTLGQAIFHEMFGDPAVNPMNWDVIPLSELGRLDRGVSKHRPRNEPSLLGGEHPLIQTGDVSRAGDYIRSFSSTYSDLGLAQSRMWAKGTLCITIAANIADTAILNFDACFPDSVVGFDSGHEATNFFVHRWFATVKNRLENIAPAVAQKNINLGILRTLPVINPPRDLLQQYFEKEQGIVGAADNATNSMRLKTALFASLQHRAFRGEL